MRNIYILPTDKPSRLIIIENKLLLSHAVNWESKPIDWEEGDGINQNIYITSNEEIKEGDWCIDKYNVVYKQETDKVFTEFTGSKKIILSTDSDLVGDSIQAIDDEFLEWFVKNPRYEEVEVKEMKCTGQCWKFIESDYEDTCTSGCELNGEYKIIIPKEEPKQETLQEYLQICKYCSSEEVARCKWVNVNTEEIYSADSGTTLEWCFNCKSETSIIDKEDYE